MMREMPECPPPAPQFLTCVPRRGYQGHYKFHKTLGHAKNAVRQGVYGKIWQWDGDRWVLLYDVPPHTKYSELPWNVEKAAIAKAKEAEYLRQQAKARVASYVKELEGL